jgi:HK97 family phage prohead protease
MRPPKIDRKTEYFPIMGGEIKATNDDQGIVEGYLNYIGNVDFGDDRTMPGAFRKTIADSYSRKSVQGLDFLWPYLWNHDYGSLPPGGIFEANEDKSGLYIKTQFNLDMQMGRELYSSFKLGTMKKQSMGYKAIRYEYVKDAGRSIRNLQEVAIMEGSAVVFPMNDLASVSTVKNTGKRTFIMPGDQKPSKKDFAATYQDAMQDDWLSDLYLPWYALKSEILSAFAMGDQPIEDTRAALAQFNDAMLAYVQQGVDLGMVEALQPDEDDSGSNYGYMSDNPDHQSKAGRMISAANHASMTKAVKGIAGHVEDIKSILNMAAQSGGAQTMSRDAREALPLSKSLQEQTADAALATQLGDLLASIEISKLLRK